MIVCNSVIVCGSSVVNIEVSSMADKVPAILFSFCGNIAKT